VNQKLHDEVALPLSEFRYDLPAHLIAQKPVEPRDQSRLLVLDKTSGGFEHRHFMHISEILDPGDLIVINKTKVFPARLKVFRPSGKEAELCFIEPVEGDYQTSQLWRALGRPAKSMKKAGVLKTCAGDALEVVSREDEFVVLRTQEPLMNLLKKYGDLPLPPYIKRPLGLQESDQSSYQTLFAEDEGAVAAPTAGLHFSQDVCRALTEKQISMESITLHVGPGTFLPIRRENENDVRAHQMHAEYYRIPRETLAAVEATRQRGGKVVAVGTTTVRTLESWALTQKVEGYSELFIYPGFEFRVVDAMITNFHLPESTLLLLVSAFAGRDSVLNAYEEAKKQEYRFFSYGDAMLMA